MNKFLFITYENPYTRNAGDCIYTCNILRGLKDLDGVVDIIYYDSQETQPEIPESEKETFRKARKVHFEKKNPLKFVLSTLPGMVVNRSLKRYNSAIKDLLDKEDYDAIFINHQKMLFVLPLLKANSDATTIYISHNVEYLLSKNLAKNYRSWWKSLLHWQDSLKTKAFEKQNIPEVDAVTAISEFDAEYFKSEYNVKQVELLRPVIEESNIKEDDKKSYDSIIIAGSFKWGPKKENLKLFLEAENFHKLKEAGITINIVGRADADFVKTINKSYSNVNMTGPVDSMWPYYQKSKIAVVPERLGGGFKLKVLEAALAKTAIFSVEGAIKKCDFKSNVHFIEKGSFEEIIEEILNIQSAKSRLDEMIEKSYCLAKELYTVDNMRGTLNSLINKST